MVVFDFCVQFVRATLCSIITYYASILYTMVFKSYPIRQKTQIRLICAHTIVLFCVQTLHCSYDNRAVIVYKLCANRPSSYGGVRFLCSICAHIMRVYYTQWCLKVT
jgi:hypothetical protein